MSTFSRVILGAVVATAISPVLAVTPAAAATTVATTTVASASRTVPTTSAASRGFCRLFPKMCVKVASPVVRPAA